MRRSRWDEARPRPVVHADGELAFASLLGLVPSHGTADAHSVRAGMLLGLVVGLVLALALLSLGAVS